MKRLFDSLKARRRSRAPSCKIPRRILLRGVELLETRRMLAAVSWTGLGDQINWTDPNNWSTQAVPGPSDDVTISIAGNPTIQLSSGTQSINSLVTTNLV